MTLTGSMELSASGSVSNKMDLLDMDVQEMYFDKPLPEGVAGLISDAADAYGEPEAEALLQKALKVAPEHPMVHVALYRYYFYQHRFAEALAMADKTITDCAAELGYSGAWEAVTLAALQASEVTMTRVRYYLMALKGAGLICLRMGRWEEGESRLKKVAELDAEDRLGASAILQVVDGWDR